MSGTRRPVVLLTGASGEIGHSLITKLAEDGSRPILTLDLKPLPRDLARLVEREYIGSILERNLLERILSEFEIDLVFHLAALLSTRGEFTPVTAHQVNVEGMLNLLEFAQSERQSHGRPVKFLYPSSIAAYGMPDLAAKAKAGRVKEDDYLQPTTMYGCNKLYTEHLGRYYARHYKQLSADPLGGRVDFRCVRFPGLISAFTVPSGGTSDYAPEMLHHAAQGKPYACFVREDARIPFMAMPDGVEALLRLAAAPQESLSRVVYNVGAFAPTAGEIRELVLKSFPKAEITFAPDLKRQGIVDSWPGDVDDSAARADWGYAPRFGLEAAFGDYLIPNIRKAYVGGSSEEEMVGTS
ncbi:MAG: NAD-dependent epimerase/dehydratase family protein [Acidobacteria bacterium]|nr:NAD-dependent epimerase/dehydratase family protein [Acidobacteriota bacterium]